MLSNIKVIQNKPFKIYLLNIKNNLIIIKVKTTVKIYIVAFYKREAGQKNCTSITVNISEHRHESYDKL